VNVLLDTTVLSEPMRQQPDAAVMAQLEKGGHRLHTASVVIHELRYGVQRLPKGRRRARLNSYVQGVLASGLTVLAYDTTAAIAATQGLVLVTRNIRDFEVFDGLQLLNWFEEP
jgi:tRNA(fMet)-specific endonuclease VapC